MFNLTSATTSNNVGGSNFNGDIDFTYDSKDRLLEENSSRFSGYDEDNVFDGAGNPTTFRDSASRTYNCNNQRSNTGYTYDGNGNPTTYATVAHTFDKENRLTGHGTTSYDYRADGLRAWMQTTFLGSTEKRYYLYDQGQAVVELNSAGSVVATNVYAPDGLVARKTSSTTWQYLFDWQGNAAHGMTSSSTVSISSAFTAWGQRNYVYPFQAPSQWDDCMGYNARWGYRQDASGYYYCQNRYYDPANGRWLTRDPIGYAGGINMYGYCGSGPVGAMDRGGQFVETLWDVVNVGLDIWDLGSSLLQGDMAGAGSAGLGLLGDALANGRTRRARWFGCCAKGCQSRRSSRQRRKTKESEPSP